MRRLFILLVVLILSATACSSSEQATGTDPDPAATSAAGDTGSDSGSSGEDANSGTSTSEDDSTATGDDQAQFRRGRLRVFDACDAYLDHMRTEAGERVSAYGLNGGGVGIAEFARGREMIMEGDMAMEDAAVASDTKAGADSASVAEGAAAPPEAPISDFAESDGAGANGGATFSETNNQVSGVDEPDIVKTDGDRIITLTNQTLQVFRIEGDAAVDAGSVTADFYPTDMLLSGDTVLLLGMSWGEEVTENGGTTTLAPNTGLTTIQQVDISGTPTVTNTLRLEGNMVSARRIDTTARIVVSAPPPELGFVYPDGPNGEDAALKANQAIVEESTLDDWMSNYELIAADGSVDTGQIVDCNRIYYPTEFSGYNLLSVLTVDISEAITPGNATAVVADGQTVYASAESLYVATTRWPEVFPVEPMPLDDAAASSAATVTSGEEATEPSTDYAEQPPSGDAEAGFTESEASKNTESEATDSTSSEATKNTESEATDSTESEATDSSSSEATDTPPDAVIESPDQAEGAADEEYTTSIHRFDITDPTQATYVASGEVTGHLLSQFSLDEYEGNLRVATTSGSPWGWGGRSESESYISVLALDGENLNVVGQVGGLGKGEQIYSVRFMGPDAYVVTFRQIDPFYVVDLAEPTKPTVVGELKIPGYSSYLHPVGEDRILGVGQDGTEEGQITGAKASLFDVSDPANPTEIAVWTSTDGNSAVEYDHHAFLWWDETGQAVLPLTSWEEAWSGAVVLKIDGDTITEQGRVDQKRDDEEVFSSPCAPVDIKENYFGPGTTVEVCSADQVEVATERPGAGCEVISKEEFAQGWLTELGVDDLEIPDQGSVIMCYPINGGLPPQIRRSLVIDDTLWTVSEVSVQANALATLDQLSRTDLTVSSR